MKKIWRWTVVKIVQHHECRLILCHSAGLESKLELRSLLCFSSGFKYFYTDAALCGFFSAIQLFFLQWNEKIHHESILVYLPVTLKTAFLLVICGLHDLKY